MKIIIYLSLIIIWPIYINHDSTVINTAEINQDIIDLDPNVQNKNKASNIQINVIGEKNIGEFFVGR